MNVQGRLVQSLVLLCYLLCDRLKIPRFFSTNQKKNQNLQTRPTVFTLKISKEKALARGLQNHSPFPTLGAWRSS